MKIYDERENRAIVWDNYKAGVMNTETGEIIVPIRFDEVHWRIRSFRSPGPRIPPPPIEIAGFACFTDDGEAIAYDFDGNVSDWKDWEIGRVQLTPPKRPERTREEVEKEICDRYHMDIEREEIEDLLYERARIINFDWEHTPENVRKVGEINDRLNAAIREALRLGEEAEKLVKGKCDDWRIEVEVYPEWEDPDWDGNNSGLPWSIQNIIAELGRKPGFSGHSPCFTWMTYPDGGNTWDFKEATMDDGVSWDEGSFRRPAYMDLYFVHPFQELFFDNYIFAHEDLLSIKNFYINVLINKADR